jgi:hypothetical protein
METVLKGHGFSRADFEAQNVTALAAEGRIEVFKTIPQGSSPEFLWLFSGTAEAVPFQSPFSGGGFFMRLP